MVAIEKQESVLTGSKKSHSPTIIAAACLLLLGCTESTRQVGQTARPVTTAPARIADRGPSEPRFADMAGAPIDLASLPAEPVAVDRVPAPPPTPKPRQSLVEPAPSVPNPAAVVIKPAPSVPNPAAVVIKPAPSVPNRAAVEIKPAAGPTSTGPSAVARPSASDRMVVASRTPVDPVPETGPPSPDSSAVEVIDQLGRRTLAVLSDSSKTPVQRQKYFQGLIASHVDIPMLAKFLAGRYWRRASAAQRTAYVSAFTDFLLEVFARQLGGAQLVGFEVLGSKPVGRRDVMVMSRLDRGGKPVKVEWRLRRRDNRFLVIDVTAEGVSMAMTRRQEFAAIIRANGGRFDGLITKLQEYVSNAS